jgi:tRNA threonylcarbamoyladenosine biosynthesis protein TsaE
MQLKVRDKKELQVAAARLLSEFPDRRVFTFTGDLGAGKTTFIKALCKELKVTDVTSSPTFAVVNEYRTEQKGAVYHFDLYRMKSLSEVFDTGIEEYLYSGNYCFIEWPDRAEDLIPGEAVRVVINVIDDIRHIGAEAFTLS